MAIALENLYSRCNWALGIEGEGFSEGMYCVAPERRAPLSERPSRGSSRAAAALAFVHGGTVEAPSI